MKRRLVRRFYGAWSWICGELSCGWLTAVL